MTVAAGSVPDIAGRVRSVLPVIEANAAEGERRRWILEQNIELLTEAGFFRLSVPRQFGGVDASLAEQVPLINELAAACPSTAWVCATWAAHVWMVRLYPAAAQQEILTQDSVRVAGAFSPTGTLTPVEGGYRLSGAWKWNSGCRGADWDTLAAHVEGADASSTPFLGYALVRTAELTIHDDWHAMGLAGTGSSMVTADDAFVPAHRVMPIHDLLTGRYAADAEVGDGRGYAFFPLLLVTGIGLYSGMARGALNAFLARIPGRGITYTPWTDQAQHPHVHIQTAKAAARIEAAECLADRLMSRLQTAADTGEQLSLAQRSWFRGLAGEAIVLCREAVELLWSMAGGSAIMLDVPLQRYFRDIESLALHAVMSPDASFETYGRSLLGLDPGTPFL